MIERILVAGGGTGGHLFPGIAVVEELRRRLPDLDVLFVGTERGIEARVVPQLGERFFAVDVKPLLGRRPLELTRSLLALPGAGVAALGTVRAFRPDVVLGLGGYAAGPLVMAARALGVPCALLEQNAHVGLTNRLLSRAVGRAYLTYEETVEQFGATRARVLGNPVRRAFVEAARAAGHDPQGVEARSRGVLVLGGSLGARPLNERVPEALARAGLAASGTRVLHQAGADDVAAVQRRYAELGLDAEVTPFIDDMARAYSNASLVIGRAGATTLAELCAIGRASVLVPLPHAAEDHQTMNALALERAGAAVALPQAELTVEALAEQVGKLLEDVPRRRAMAAAARRLGKPDAAAAVVDDLMGWLGVPTEAAPSPEGGPDGAGTDDEDDGPSLASMRAPVRRRPKLQRSQLRLRMIEADAEPTPMPAVALDLAGNG